MQRLLVVYNPNSTNFGRVKTEIFPRLKSLKGHIIGKFEIKKVDFESNVSRLAKILKDDDLVLAAGGDATAAVVVNAIKKSGKSATFSVLPYGNFNDLARTLGTSGWRSWEGSHGARRREAPRGRRGKETSDRTRSEAFYPLEVYVDGKFWRYATCYVTMGMTAESVALFDEPNFRRYMQKGHKSSWRSYLALVKWYFKNRHKKVFLPEFTLNGKKVLRGASDYAAVNGKRMCRVMKGGDDFKKPRVFRSTCEKTISFPRLFVLMAKSILRRIPGLETTGDIIEFAKPATVTLQAEGEYCTFKDITKIEIKKSAAPLRALMKGAK